MITEGSLRSDLGVVVLEAIQTNVVWQVLGKAGPNQLVESIKI